MDMDVDDEVHLVDEEDISDSKSGSKRKQKERKERSPVWLYFIKHTNKKVGNRIPTECKKCHHITMYNSGQGTANEFRYPILARMARDFLTIPVSTVASESTFSASGRVITEHRSSLSKATVDNMHKRWLHGDFCSNKVSVEKLTEDIMSLDISCESNASNSVNNPKV
ncbi:putative HAT dimerization domain, ribonuclease H-like superfamily [Helianthus annuus]|nr:putative HAT dimerization domain, ribonuclease H-like superfamily [Helianthus annuus]